jgi:hypothetical protein
VKDDEQWKFGWKSVIAGKVDGADRGAKNNSGGARCTLEVRESGSVLVLVLVVAIWR